MIKLEGIVIEEKENEMRKSQTKVRKKEQKSQCCWFANLKISSVFGWTLTQSVDQQTTWIPARCFNRWKTQRLNAKRLFISFLELLFFFFFFSFFFLLSKSFDHSSRTAGKANQHRNRNKSKKRSDLGGDIRERGAGGGVVVPAGATELNQNGLGWIGTIISGQGKLLKKRDEKENKNNKHQRVSYPFATSHTHFNLLLIQAFPWNTTCQQFPQNDRKWIHIRFLVNFRVSRNH